MLKQVIKTFVAIAAVMFFAQRANVLGQQKEMDIGALMEASVASFEQGNYRASLTGFRTLMAAGGTDPMYGYYAGRCLVALNEDLDEAIELLYGASGKNVPEDAVFFLGRAYHLYYNFSDARKCYEQFERTASRQERKLYNVEQLIETCQSASEITSSYNPYEVMNVTFLDLSDSLQYAQVKMKGGDLVRKPETFFRNDEDRTGLTSLMFRPADPLRGDYMFFSGYGKNEKDGAQIFRVRKMTANAWGEPREVEFLNGPGDEILPYFDPVENDLYFASNGRNGIGGFDLYKSHFDMDRDQWSEPVNLGFPVNSAADDYLLLPGSDLGMVLFFSNREGTDSTVTVYRVHLAEPKKKTASGDPRQLREIAMLGGVANEILAELEEADAIFPGLRTQNDSGNEMQIGSGNEMQIGSGDERQNDSGAEPAAEEKNTEERAAPQSFQETLSLALMHQAVSDSLKDLATDARVKVRESDDPNDRWVWQKQIMVWEKRARDEEEMADQLYAEVNREPQGNQNMAASDPPEAIEVDRVVDGLTVYRYATAGPVLINSFELLEQSPYNATHPIPMDEALPPGTFYRIQLGAYAGEIAPDHFGGITPITGEYYRERGLFRYYAGKFSRYEDASTALPRIHSLGFEDAFIVAWYNGNQVQIPKAKQLE